MILYLEQYEGLLRKAFEEDLGTSGDWSSNLIFNNAQKGKFILRARESGVLAGIEIVASAFHFLSPSVQVSILKNDGSTILSGDDVLVVEGPLVPILTSERTALNFLTHLSGIATLTRAFVEKVRGFSCRIADTRKTLPGLRSLEKYAVRMGGGVNHRFGLYDMIMLKDNHVKYSGGIAQAVKKIREKIGHSMKIQVEADTLEQFYEILDSGADCVLLDNMTLDELNTATSAGKGKIILEASGGVTIETVRGIAETGVDIISVGRLTHSAPAMDFGLDAG